MSLNKKRDRSQIIAEILNSCRNPQTQTYIRRQTNISYDVLHGCTMQLLLRKWITEVYVNGQKKLAVTQKGLVFLDKWAELQQTMSSQKTRKPRILALNTKKLAHN